MAHLQTSITCPEFLRCMVWEYIYFICETGVEDLEGKNFFDLAFFQKNLRPKYVFYAPIEIDVLHAAMATNVKAPLIDPN